MAKVAVSVEVGAAASMGGMVTSGAVVFRASSIVFLSLIVSFLLPLSLTMCQADKAHGVRIRAHIRLANPVFFRKSRLFSRVRSVKGAFVVF
jgi:hypothetical protein